ncbi:MAG: ABC transporter permease subunit [Asgard group archaeon]|nr:ABC transporter permease subunit [Asgard group archaeon]
MSEIEAPEKTSFVPMELEGKKKRKSRLQEGKRYFGLYTLFQKTFLELLSLKRVVPYLFLSVIFPFIFSTIVAQDLPGKLADMNIDYQIATVVNYFAFYSFFWNAGILLWLFCGLTASTFISSEENNGTMIFLLTKPIRRSTIYIGKFLGYFLNMAILQFVSLILSLTTTCSILQVSRAVFTQGMYYLLPIYLFSILMIACIGLILGFLSIINKRVVVSVLVNMFLIILIYFVGIIFRVAIPQYYAQWYLYLIDLGYNLSLIFTFFLNLFGFLPTPFFQQNIGMFFGTYAASFGDNSGILQTLEPENGLTFLIPETGYINPLVSLTALVVITVILLILGIILLERKDISP